ncbi:MAG: adenylate/guanylate cyclase domain-containing protein [Gammaproteobacteria bacterium]|nr:adenylate/guanylate cyclase domain-containing protein [Gammaproteobacteria bacterium]
MKQVVETRVVLFADIGGSTELYEKIGDIEAHRQVAASLELMAEAIFANQGELLRTVGDSSLASFNSANDAYLAAFDMQRQHEHADLSVRVGFHLGPVIPDKGDVYGNAVNIAARVASFARVNEIVATEDAVEALNASLKNRSVFLDRIEVKGLATPISLYRMNWKVSEESATVIAGGSSRDSSWIKPGVLHLSSGVGKITMDSHFDSASIGRAEEATLSINNEHASRYHAKIEWRQGQFFITDQSTNGTYIQKVGQNPLFLRRDSVVLEGSGAIGVGILPELDSSAVIRFVVDVG